MVVSEFKAGDLGKLLGDGDLRLSLGLPFLFTYLISERPIPTVVRLNEVAITRLWKVGHGVVVVRS